MSTLRSKSVEDVGEEGADVAQIVTATAKKVLISQVVKRNVIENVVPVVISLKHMVSVICWCCWLDYALKLGLGVL